MKSKALKTLIAASLVTGAVSLSTTASADDNLTPDSWSKDIVDKGKEGGCGEGGCGENGCGEKGDSEEEKK